MFPTLDSTLLDQEAFAALLHIERKRTDRSQRLLLLLLLKFGPLTQDKRRQRKTLVKNVIQSLRLGIRETDMMGWYKNNTVVGVLFTELHQEKPAVKSIMERVNATLRARLTAAQIAAITMSVHVYPHRDLRAPDASANDELYPSHKRQSTASLLKRLIDILGSLALLLVLTPLFGLIGVAVKLTSKGPILFRQTRVGHLGRPFTLLKFRSMYVNADSKVHERYVKEFVAGEKNGDSVPEALKQDGMFKLSKDPRITPLGRFIRKTSLDELPQLLNVLAGYMSLVGPRPPTDYEVKCYDPWHMRRILEARPGLTGLWQVKGRSRTTFDDMVRLDLTYLDKWSIWHDLKILLQTPWVVLKGEGAR